MQNNLDKNNLSGNNLSENLDKSKTKIVYKPVGRIRRTHALDGAVVVQLVTETYYDAIELLKNAFEAKKNVIVDEKELIIERLFGHVKDVCRVQFAGYDINEAKTICNEYIEAQYDGFDYDRLIGLPIKDSNGKLIAKISSIHNFGAGIVCDTNKDMFLFDELNLVDVRKGVLYLK